MERVSGPVWTTSMSDVGSSRGLTLLDQRRVSFRDLSTPSLARTTSGPALDHMTNAYSSSARPRSASSASRAFNDASSTAASISSWTQGTQSSKPYKGRRSSFLGTLSLSTILSGGGAGKKRRQLQHSAPTPDLFDDVLEITAGPTEDELERERLRTAAAQAVGIRPSPPSPPPQSASLPLHAYPVPPFPSTITLLAPRATAVASVTKKMSGNNFFGRAQWKQRLAMLTPRNVHILAGQEEVERLVLAYDTVAYVADDEPGLGGRRSVIRLGSDHLWWMFQMRDAAQMHEWLQALKAAIAQRPSPEILPLPPVVRVVSTTPTSPSFLDDSASSASSPTSSTRMPRPTSALPSVMTTAQTLNRLLSARRIGGRPRSPSEPQYHLASTMTPLPSPGLPSPTQTMAFSIGRKIVDDEPDTDVNSINSILTSELPDLRLTGPQGVANSLPPPPRRPRLRPTPSSPVPSPLVTTDTESLSQIIDIDHPSPDMAFADLPPSRIRSNRASLLSTASANSSERPDIEHGPLLRHPFSAAASIVRSKRLSTSSALSAGSSTSTSGGSGTTTRALRVSGASVPPQRPPPVGALPPTPANSRPLSLPSPGPLPTLPTTVLQLLDDDADTNKRASLPVGGVSLTDTVAIASTSRRAVRASMPLPPTLPPSGPLPMPPANSRARASVTFADSPELLTRTSASREASDSSSKSKYVATEEKVGDKSSPSVSEVVSRRKRISLRLRFSKTLPVSDAAVLESHEDGHKRSESLDTQTQASSDVDHGISFFAPATPSDELQVFFQQSSAMQDLFTVPPIMTEYGRPLITPGTPPLYPAPTRPMLLQSTPTNPLLANVLTQNALLGRSRAASISTLDVEPPEPRSLSPPPPRRPERKRASTVSVTHGKRGSVSSINGVRRTRLGDDTPVNPGRPATANLVPLDVKTKTQDEGRTIPSFAILPIDNLPASLPNLGLGQCVDISPAPVPRIGLDGDILLP
ncbi:hypothetical protein BKA62DRAFT_681239 [Auriculariales sp. MPI-PUGE-AT-0066]|nr:hypothetical protein BKA62DRAFT_681239 [Auriculariales sp. MPI-PUGE-AT-0066]